MLDWISAGIIGFLSIFARGDSSLQPLELFSWQDTAIFNLPARDRDVVTQKILDDYLQDLARQGIDPQKQGVWIQSDWGELASIEATKPKSAASLTKIATTIAALSEYGANYQFETKIYVTGEISNGVLSGDLIVEGSGDPLFVWEEAIALGNAVQKLGIQQVRGNLLVTDKFYMNYKSDTVATGKLLQQALNSQLWQTEIKRQYLSLPPDTPKPEIAIAKSPKTISQVPTNARLLIRHKSLPLAEILRQMNIYSNNKMAQMLADLLGGADKVARYAANITKVPQQEIQLINGSGLGEENRISPRAVCQMLIEIDRLLASHPIDVMDLFPVAGRDTVGTIRDRSLPNGTAVKTGTLDRVSAIAGILHTSDRGKIWFAIINNGGKFNYFRGQQDKLLQDLVQNWQPSPQYELIEAKSNWYLGDPSRNSYQTSDIN